MRVHSSMSAVVRGPERPALLFGLIVTAGKTQWDCPPQAYLHPRLSPDGTQRHGSIGGSPRPVGL